MSVLEAPQTWIAAAAVLVVVAVVLIALAPRRRRNAFVSSAGAAGTAATPTSADDDAVTTPVGPIAAPLETSAVDAGPDGTGRRTGDWFRSGQSEGNGASDLPQRDERVPEPAGADDGDVTGATVPVADPAPTSVPAPPPAAETAPATPSTGEDARQASPRPTPRYVAVSDPARAGERAKDRLLAALLADPDGAVDVVTAMSEDGEASGTAAASLLRAGLTPAQVAGLCGVDETELATLVARDLGLLASSQRDQDGRSRTEEPGRAWASAGSAPASTTPTTG